MKVQINIIRCKTNFCFYKLCRGKTVRTPVLVLLSFETEHISLLWYWLVSRKFVISKLKVIFSKQKWINFMEIACKLCNKHFFNYDRYQ